MITLRNHGFISLNRLLSLKMEGLELPADISPISGDQITPFIRKNP
jgi:hypothetical protein